MSDSPKNPGLAGAVAVEITPEMIEAGAEVVRDEIDELGVFCGDPDKVAESVYKAMSRLSLSC